MLKSDTAGLGIGEFELGTRVKTPPRLFSTVHFRTLDFDSTHAIEHGVTRAMTRHPDAHAPQLYTLLHAHAILRLFI